MRVAFARLALLLFAALACAPRQPALVPATASNAAPVQLVESSPVETNLDHADIPNAKDVWLAMIAGASGSLDFAEFYASNEPGSSLEAVIQAIEAAADRGVNVRFLAEDKFY